MRLVAPPCRPWRRLSPTKHHSDASSSPPPRVRALSKDSLLSQPPPTASASSSSSAASSRISPAVLFTIVILAAIFFVAGLLHLLVRFLLRKRGGGGEGGGGGASSPADLPRSGTLQRQLQQLFHLHDAGLDQAFIDSLPLFLYREILHNSEKEPFDCAVCLCEFAPDDKLRLLPVCGHAFHLACIDTWLLSNSTCPLCRGLILVHGAAIENPVFAFDDSMPENDDEEQDDFSAGCDGRMLPVRLGKFKKLSNGGINGDLEEENSITELGETSSSSLDARRCFSMGYYQYVVADASLQVALGTSAINAGRRNLGNAAARGSNELSKGKRLGIGSRDESFSVSKIWQWSEKKGMFPVSSADAAAALDARLPWIRSSGEYT